MTKPETERTPYVAIIRKKDSEYPIFANKVEGDIAVDKFITVFTTNKEGKQRKLRVAVEIISEYEEILA